MTTVTGQTSQIAGAMILQFPNDYVNGRFSANGVGTRILEYRSTITALSILVFPSEHFAGQRRKVLIASVPLFAWPPANLNRLASAVSGGFVCLSAVLAAVRNDSVLAGACTSPDRILRKDMFFP